MIIQYDYLGHAVKKPGRQIPIQSHSIVMLLTIHTDQTASIQLHQVCIVLTGKHFTDLNVWYQIILLHQRFKGKHQNICFLNIEHFTT